MSETRYEEALKLGKKEQKRCLASGRFPYLPVLDEILTQQELQGEEQLGLQQIPLEHVVGTSTRGRTYAFAANFMPILGLGTEFSMKWINLAEAQMNEGIRDPIIAYEFLNRFYVVEGNKRVSVLKYYEADSISAIVTRKIPKLTEDDDIKLYYELMEFMDITGLNTIEFTRLGKANQLLELMEKTEKWDKETRADFNSVLFRFQKAYKARGGLKLPITIGDAITAFMNVYGYEKMLTMTETDYTSAIVKCWNEFLMLTRKQNVDLVMNPEQTSEKRSLLRYFIPSSSKRFTVAFLYSKTAEESDWIYAHDLGRSYLEHTFPEQIYTICKENVKEENIEEVLEEVIEDGATIIFCTAPQMMKPSLKVAVEHPEVKILNCSLNAPHKYVRTYYARMYEAKFLSGMIAGAMAENDKIAYIADYPIYGMIANINAFALGAACVNPRAKIYLEWSTKKDYHLERFLKEHEIHYVSNQDMITPRTASREFGLYKYDNGETRNLAMPLWNWGIFYEKMIQTILAGAYESKDNAQGKALNYWWGMSAGVIDLICSKHVPSGVRGLIEHMKEDIHNGSMSPFSGEIYDQNRELKNEANTVMKPEDIMKMDWLVENVIGDIPTKDEITDGAKIVVKLQGVEENK